MKKKNPYKGNPLKAAIYSLGYINGKREAKKELRRTRRKKK